MQEKMKTDKPEKLVFLENPYDVEVVFESLSVASDADMELIFMDMLINRLRDTKDCDITDISFRILQDLKLLK